MLAVKLALSNKGDQSFKCHFHHIMLSNIVYCHRTPSDSPVIMLMKLMMEKSPGNYMTQTWPETPMFVRLGTCVYTRAWISVPLCLCVEIHIKDIMRDRSCITQLGQSSRGAAGSSSRQMENVLAPLHAWDPQYFFSCQHGKEPGKPAAQFQGYVIPRTCKPGRPGAELLRLSYFVENGLLSWTWLQLSNCSSC